jgi:hypothetical protein
MPQAQTPQNSRWWADFHQAHGMASEEEIAFLGYLSRTHPTQPQAALELSPEQLDAALAACQAFVAAS